jgi:hypothetical protein
MDLRILSDEELLALANDVNRELLKRVPAGAAPAAETPAPFVAPRCPYCNGTGRKVDGEYCTCVMGHDLQRVERRGLSRFAPADLKYAGPEPEYANEDEDEEES